MRGKVALLLVGLGWGLCSGLCSCTYFTGDDRVLVTSTPAGAEILIDGQDSQRTTPALLELGGIAGSDHVLLVRKRGFAEETRTVYHYTTTYTSTWIEGAASETLPTCPIFWTIGDVVLPFAVRWRYVPHQIHVQLHKIGEAPVHESGETTPAK